MELNHFENALSGDQGSFRSKGLSVRWSNDGALNKRAERSNNHDEPLQSVILVTVLVAACLGRAEPE